MSTTMLEPPPQSQARPLAERIAPTDERLIAFVYGPPQDCGDDACGGRPCNHGAVLIVQGQALVEWWRRFHNGETWPLLDWWPIEELTPDNQRGLFVWAGRCLNWDEREHIDWEPRFAGEWRRCSTTQCFGLVIPPSSYQTPGWPGSEHGEFR